jgi:NADPH:quinone reductase-like Zn-dependent oxidoreductase
MKALRFYLHGGVDQLVLDDIPIPEPAPGEVRIRIKMAALNHLDLFVLAGMPNLPLNLPQVCGADGAGLIDALGDGVRGWEIGERVLINPGLCCGACEFCRRGEQSLCVDFKLLGEHANGTFAQYICIPARMLGRVPEGWDWAQAAAFPLAALTAWRMLMGRAKVRLGETVLIHGIGGGVSLMALQIAKAAGATVFATSSSTEKLAHAKLLGADHLINYTTADVAREVLKLTGKRGVDVVVDTVGEKTWMSSLKAAAKGGRIVTCGCTSGPNPAEEIRLIFWKQLSILGSTMCSDSEFAALLRAAPRLAPVVDRVFPLDEARLAYQRLMKGEQLGKIVIDLAQA